MDQRPKCEAWNIKISRWKTYKHGIIVGENFLNMKPFIWELRPTIGKWDFTKLKNFYIGKEIIK